MTDVCEVFKRDPNDTERELKKTIYYYRQQSMRYGSWKTREIAQFCQEWQEVTGRILESGNRPGYEEKFADAERRRRINRELDRRGLLGK